MGHAGIMPWCGPQDAAEQTVRAKDSWWFTLKFQRKASLLWAVWGCSSRVQVILEGHRKIAIGRSLGQWGLVAATEAGATEVVVTGLATSSGKGTKMLDALPKAGLWLGLGQAQRPQSA